MTSSIVKSKKKVIKTPLSNTGSKSSLRTITEVMSNYNSMQCNNNYQPEGASKLNYR